MSCRLVLASCSSFLSSVFLGLPEGLPEFTFIVPNIKKDVVNTFIEFLYTVRRIWFYVCQSAVEKKLHCL